MGNGGVDKKKVKGSWFFVVLFMFFMFIFLVGTVVAATIQDDLHLNLQVTDSGGEVITGTFDFVFNVTTDSGCNNVVYSDSSTLTTDSRGIISYYLEGVDLSYSDQLYLCYYRDTVLINASQIARTPYAFRAKYVNVSGIQVDQNFDLSGFNFTADYLFGDGRYLTNINVSEIDLSSYVPYTGASSNLILGNNNFSVNTNTFFVDSGLGRVGIGTTTPGYPLEINGTTKTTNLEITNLTSVGSGTYVLKYDPATDQVTNYAPIIGGVGTAKYIPIYSSTYAFTKSANFQYDWTTNVLLTKHLNATGNITSSGFVNATTDICIEGGNCLSGTVMSGGETDPLWSENFTLYNSTWSSTYNASYVPYVGATGNVVLGDNNFSVGGTDLFVDNNLGRVGIGTSSPSAPLDIDMSGSGENMKFSRYAIDYDSSLNIRSGNGGYLSLKANGAGDLNLYSGNSAGAEINFYTLNTQRAIIDTDGNVGIGTTTPQRTLHVNGDILSNSTINATGDICIEGGNCLSGTVMSGGEVDPYWTGNWTNVAFTNIDETFDENLIVMKNFTVDTNTFFVDSGLGRVGVGTVIPQNTLNVIGAGNFTGGVTIPTTQAYRVGGTDVFWADTGANHSIGIGESTSTSIDESVFIGYQAGYLAKGGSGDHTIVGYGAGYNSSGNVLTAYGRGAGSDSTANEMVVMGTLAGGYNTGAYFTAIGRTAGYKNQGGESTFVGYNAGYLNTGGESTGIGDEALYNNTYRFVTGVGERAGYNNKAHYGSFLGSGAGKSNTGTSVTAVGYNAGSDNSGASSTYVGANAGQYSSGGSSAGVGYQALYNNTGINSNALGYEAGEQNEGTNVIAIGRQAGQSNTGNYLIALGYQAGKDNTLANQFIVQHVPLNAVPLLQGNLQTNKLGVNTATPQNTLNVVGDINATTNIYSGGFVNATTDICIEGGNCLSDVLSSYSETDPLWSENFTLYNSTWSSVVNESYYLKSNPYQYWNSTFATFNKTYADSLYYGINNPNNYYNSTTLPAAASEEDPLWSGNFTLYNSTWSSTYNASYVPYTGASSNLDLGNNNFTVDSGVFYVDSDTNKVGFGDHGAIKQSATSPYRIMTIEEKGNIGTWGSQINFDLGFNTADPTTVLTIRKRTTEEVIIPNAKVGIGTTSPVKELDVVGDINVTGDICINGGNCLSDMGVGSGDITAVNTNGAFLTGGSVSGDVNLLLNTTVLNATIWNQIDNGTFYKLNNEFGYYNSTTLPSGDPETDPLWTGNYSLYNSTWSSVVNESYYLATNPYAYYNSTTLPSGDPETDPLWTGNYSLYNSTWSSTYNSTYNSWAYNQTIPAMNYADSTFLRKDGDNGTGTYNFNGGWTSNGVSVIGGNIYAQSGYFYDINSLSVSNLAINGSLYPEGGFDNTFDIGNDTLRWRDAHFAGNVYTNGSYCIDGDCIDSWSNVNLSESDPLWSANYSLYNSTWSSTYNASYVPYTGAVSNVDLGANNFSVGGADLFVDNDLGRVGIGKTNPVYALDVVGEIDADDNIYLGGKKIVRDANNYVYFGEGYNYGVLVGDGTETIGVNYQNKWITFETNNNERMRIDSTGKIGVNTETPQNILNVVGDINATTNIYSGGFVNVSSGGDICIAGGNCLSDVLSSYSETDPLWTENFTLYNDTWSSTYNASYVPYTGAVSNVDLGANNFTVDTDVFVINKDTNNVGIGTTSPSSNLEIYRQSAERTTLSTILTLNSDGSNPYTGFGSKITWNSEIYQSGHAETGYLGVVMGPSYNTEADMVFATRGSSTVSEKMRISGAGKVGIGTTAPKKELDVVGTINATTDVCINGGNCLSEAGAVKWNISGSNLYPVNLNYNVGIGTNNPSSTLEVYRQSADRTTMATILNLTSDGNNPYTGFGSKIAWNSELYNGVGHVDTGYIGVKLGETHSTEADMIFATRGSSTVSEKMRILGSGNIGINTETPQNTLNVVGDINATTNIYSGGFVNATTDVCIEGGNCLSDVLSSYTETDPLWTSNYSLYNTSWSSIVNESYYLKNNPFGFYNSTTLPSGGTVTGSGTVNYVPLWNGTESLGNSVIRESGGNIGIGVAPSATYDLYVGGRFRATDYIQAGSTITAGSGLVGPYFRMPSGGANLNLGIRTTGDDFIFGIVSGAELMRLTGEGKLGINTPTPQNTLNVVGDFNATTNIYSGGFVNVSSGGDICIEGGNCLSGTVMTGGEVDPLWTSNFTLYNSTWSSIVNESYYLKNNPFGFYNSTTLPSGGTVTGSGTSMRFPLWNGTQSLNNSNVYQGSNGNIGIGSSDPKEKLEVAGNVNITGNLSLGTVLIYADTNGDVNVW